MSSQPSRTARTASSARVWTAIGGKEAAKVVGLAAFLPLAVGLLLSVPVGIATARRGRGPGSIRSLLRDVVPLLTILVIGLPAIATLVAGMVTTPTAAMGHHGSPGLEHLWVEPSSYFARGLMAAGIGLSAGVLITRTPLAYGTSVSVLAVTLLAGVPVLQQAISERHAVWAAEVCSADPDQGCDQPEHIDYLEAGYRTTDGTILSDGEASRLAVESCPSCRRLRAPIWDELTPIHRVVPPSSYDAYVAAEALAFTAIGLGGFALAFVVVAERSRRATGPS